MRSWLANRLTSLAPFGYFSPVTLDSYSRLFSETTQVSDVPSSFHPPSLFILPFPHSLASPTLFAILGCHSFSRASIFLRFFVFFTTGVRNRCYTSLDLVDTLTPIPIPISSLGRQFKYGAPLTSLFLLSDNLTLTLFTPALLSCVCFFPPCSFLSVFT